ncbi:E3 ubiquitin-protein ligase XIAP-like [Babylonia areolata]|uniref:E3 ubiquitin-protein ligase XIAP-like n=1 Tax=Babylonia areolata TaxID=304850 RepID=UPI003FD4FE92
MSTFQSDMNNEFRRYATFSGFHSPDGIWPLQMARAGFYRSGTCEEFQVVCFACGLMLDLRTVSKDSVMTTHRRLAPNCSFVVGCSDNQPVPPVNPGAAMEWLNHNFSFSTRPESDQPQQIPSLSHSTVSNGAELAGHITLSMSQLQDLTNLGTLESDQAGLPSLPMDFLDGFANATLDSVPAVQLFQGTSHTPSGQQFSSDLQAPGEVLVTDSVPDGIEGAYPPQVMVDSEIGSYSNNTTLPPQNTGELGDADFPCAEKLTFGDLGIITQRPKCPGLATLHKRLETFDKWMGPSISQSREEIAEAGLYYAGYADCCRCFYCGGGLKSWDPEDRPWVEHARWFPKCPFVLTNKGQVFVQAVESLARTNVTIGMCDVEDEMKRISSTNLPVLLDTEVEMDNQSAEYENTETEAERLKNENLFLKEPELCKICCDREVSIVYLPCGHLVTCGTCAPTVSTCPVCRVTIAGQVRIQRTATEITHKEETASGEDNALLE